MGPWRVTGQVDIHPLGAGMAEGLDTQAVTLDQQQRRMAGARVHNRIGQ